MPLAQFVHDGDAIDYTPGADVTAGDVVVVADLVGVAKRDIASGEYGALAVTGVYDFAKEANGGVVFAIGELAYWDAGNSVAAKTDNAGANKLIGKAVLAAADADDEVRIRLSQLMADILADGSSWLEQQRTKHASRSVVYEQGDQTVEVAATIGRTIFRFDNGYGVQERFEARDYLILAADLVLGETAVLPKRGDHISEFDGDRTFIYEVMAPGKEPHWRYSDPYRQTLRIHTKLVATE